MVVHIYNPHRQEQEDHEFKSSQGFLAKTLFQRIETKNNNKANKLETEPEYAQIVTV
jgi:hypothetical protein